MSDKEKPINEQMDEMSKTFTDVWQKNTEMMTQMFNQSHQMLTQNMDPKSMGAKNMSP